MNIKDAVVKEYWYEEDAPSGMVTVYNIVIARIAQMEEGEAVKTVTLIRDAMDRIITNTQLEQI